MLTAAKKVKQRLGEFFFKLSFELKKLKKLPPVSFLAKRFSFTAFLLILLAVAAYYVGSMRTELNYLKKTNLNSALAGNPAPAGIAEPVGDLPEVGDKEHIRGERDAKVLLVEYSDLECPFCKSFHPTMQQVMKDYKGDVAWVYRQYPLGIHPNAQKYSEAAECVAELGGEDKFWAFVDKKFEESSDTAATDVLEKIEALAVKIGVDSARLGDCLASGKYSQKVKDQLAEGTRAGVKGTPATFVVPKDGKISLIPGALPIDKVK